MSSAVIMGLAVFENPRVLEGKTLLFDTQFYLGPGQSLVGAFRYFNGLDLAFGEVGQYFVYANVAKMSKHAELTTGDLNPEDYQVVGDIIWLIPVTAEDPRCRPFVQITGTAINANKDTSTFEVDSAQYTAALKNDRPFSVFPVRGLIPDSHRYKKGKPVPHNNTYVSFSGFLCRFTIDETGFPDRFYVEVENISFLGRPTVPAPIPVISPDDTQTSHPRKLKFHFDDLTNSTPNKRQKQNDGSAIPSVPTKNTRSAASKAALNPKSTSSKSVTSSKSAQKAPSTPQPSPTSSLSSVGTEDL